MCNETKSIKLTDEQSAVVKCDVSPISLRGFYGTGKTGTLCSYIVERLRRNENAMILGLSLTKLAALNLKRKLITHPDWNHIFERRVTVGTFHSFAYGYVRKFAGLVGFTASFDIDNGINEKLLRKIIDRKKYACLDDPLKLIMKASRKHVRSGKRLSEVAQGIAGNEDDAELIVEAVRELKQRKRRQNVMDFDDLLFHFYVLLRKDREVMNAVLADYTHLVVDEFQDTTGIQWRVTKLLMAAGIRFLGAGDPYQTIHRYAGSSFQRFDQLEALKGCKAFELTENHRSTKQVVALANGLLGQHSSRLTNKVTANKKGPEPEVYLAEYRPLLYQAIIKLIRRHLKHGTKLGDMAVVARFDSDLKKLMPTLDKTKVPYVFYSRQAKEEPVALGVFKAVLRIAFNRGDKKAWEIILPFLAGVGKKAQTDILKILKDNGYRYNGLNQYTENHRKNDLELLLKLFAEIQRRSDSPMKVARVILDFMKSLKKKIKDLDPYSKTITEMASGSSNIDDLFFNCQDKSFGEHHNLRGRDQTKKGITLANIHQIKGREFKVMFVLGSPDRLFENHKTFKSKLKITDELFVMLTAITRTKKHLYLLFPMTHDEWKKRIHKRNPSIFIRNCQKKIYHIYSVAESSRKIKPVKMKAE